ncbi:hypothetical protein EVAR_60946_1 [Eumeta japonica]|uniref:Uncharacterized protein n=1 Tax=Eumeta variegata TaxID=151549 RepID=A0A4C1XX87_EUMVA|nr:hypothetical protein EVAR_60946_1 [Eumeta japonica]
MAYIKSSTINRLITLCTRGRGARRAGRGPGAVLWSLRRIISSCQPLMRFRVRNLNRRDRRHCEGPSVTSISCEEKYEECPARPSGSP